MSNLWWIPCIGIVLGIFILTFDFSSPFKLSLASRMRMGKPKRSIGMFKRSGQVKISKEGPVAVGEILSCYKMNQHNMGQAIASAIQSLDQAPKTKALLSELLPILEQYQSPTTIMNKIVELEETIGTGWAKNLGEIIYCSHVMGLDVETALIDLQENLKRGKTLEEYSQRKNNEARLMVMWMVPLSYMFTGIIAIRFFDMPLSKFLYNQFQTSLGIGWFFIIGILYIVTIGTYQILGKRKLDI